MSSRLQPSRVQSSVPHGCDETNGPLTDTVELFERPPVRRLSPDPCPPTLFGCSASWLDQEIVSSLDQSKAFSRNALGAERDSQ